MYVLCSLVSNTLFVYVESTTDNTLDDTGSSVEIGSSLLYVLKIIHSQTHYFHNCQGPGPGPCLVLTWC